MVSAFCKLGAEKFSNPSLVDVNVGLLNSVALNPLPLMSFQADPLPEYEEEVPESKRINGSVAITAAAVAAEVDAALFPAELVAITVALIN